MLAARAACAGLAETWSSRILDAYELGYMRLYFGVLGPALAVVWIVFFWLAGIDSTTKTVLLLAGWLLVERLAPLLLARVGQSSRPFVRSITAALHKQPPRVVIIGAGASGLSAGALLHRAGIPYVVLEKNADVGHSWQKRYERLHLHTDKFVSGLPYLDWPSFAPLFPSRMDVVAYLQGYWRILGLNVRFNTVVASLAREGSEWRVELESGEEIRAPFVIVASGQSSVPKTEQLPEERGYKGVVMHSSTFGGAAQYADKRVLVIGIGNSGQEIAVDLVENGAASVDVAVRSPVVWGTRDVVPDRLPFGEVVLAIGGAFMPIWLLDYIASLNKTPLPPGVVKKENAKVFTGIAQCRPPILDIGLLSLAHERKVKLIQPPKDWAAYDVVVKAIGYTTDTINGSLDSFFDAAGMPKERDGLVFVGWNDFAGRIRHMTLDAIRIRNAIQKHEREEGFRK
jgi:hypothetical protein